MSVFKYFRVTPPSPNELFGYYALLYNNTLYRIVINFRLEKDTDWYKAWLSSLHNMKHGDYKKCDGYLVELLPDDFFDFNSNLLFKAQGLLNNSKYVGKGTFKENSCFRKDRNKEYCNYSIVLPVAFEYLEWEHKKKLYVFYNPKLDMVIITGRKNKIIKET